ncbi:MAG: alpha/beta fold hydrolase [Alphaproteobacteria bacterium]|nr:alpha/beta fold hydrolase [Alphaproteobacteria bacterium]
MTAEFVTVRDGGRIALETFDFTDPWTAPRTVLLVHGFSKNRRFWYRWIPELARLYRVLAIDLRCHGQSSLLPRDAELSLSTFAEDIVDLLDAFGLTSVHCVMAEFSSSVAIELGVRFGPRVSSLTLPGFGFAWRAASVDWHAWSRLAREKGSLVWAETTNRYRMDDGVEPGLRRWYVGQQGVVPAWFLAKLFELCAQLDLSDRLPLLAVPTLAINGSEGRQAPVDCVRRGVATMPNARLQVLEGLPFNVMTAAPERCTALTLDFLREIDRINPGAK